ncbi:hypothetical protein KPL70_022746 [Citrus sinensis]|nr:hypothetical protein KPL70_022746 [Citrus sinensis]
MVESEIFRIRERSTEIISGDTLGGMRDLSNRYSAPVIGGQKIDVEKFDGKINFDMWRVSMHDHVSRFEKLLSDLKNLDEDIKDEVKAMILLHSLLEEYSHFVTTLIYGKSVIVFKDVCTTLTNLEIQNNDKNSERASSEALVSRDGAMEKKKKRGGKNSRSKSKSRNIARDECSFCHEKGHWRKDCLKTQKRDGKKPTTTNMARKDEDSDYSLSITPAAYVASSSEWILDTGATYHLCPIKEWFTDFCNLESDAVVMGNDQPCRTMGIGTIRLKIFDGMVRELKEVRFVPVLKKNLISVGALEAKGYKVAIEDGIMKFTHGVMVILQGVRCHNLYYLKGGTTDEANVIEAYSDTTKLWQARKQVSSLIRLITILVRSLNMFTVIRVWVYTMRANDEVLEIFVKWKKLVETQTGRKIKVLQSDNEGEYTSDPFLQVRCMLSNAGLDKKFWAEVVSCASHLVNRLPSAAIRAYYHVKDSKLDPRARKAIFVGFKGGVKGFKFWDLEDKKFVCSRNVTFDEASMMKASSSQQVENKTKEVLQGVEFDATPYVPVSSTLEKVIDDDIPNTFGEALCSSESDQWKLAMEEEMKSLYQNQTWELVKLPKGKRAIGNKWVYTKKERSPNQSTSRYKARLVAKCFAQKEGIDYNEVFSPVVKHTSIRILLILVAEYKLELAQLDVKTAFLHGDLEEEVYMTQPCGFRVVGKENHVSLHFKLSSSSCLKSQEERDYMAHVPYASAVGSLMYAMVCTRLDISQAVSMVSRYMHNPGKNHWLAVKWILRYLYGTFDVGLLFKKDCEYMAAIEAVKEAIWLKGLLGDLGVIQENIAVFCDNQSAIFLAKNQTYQTKHIDVKFHYVREIIESGVVLLRKIDTKDNPSDMLTKKRDDPRQVGLGLIQAWAVLS